MTNVKASLLINYHFITFKYLIETKIILKLWAYIVNDYILTITIKRCKYKTEHESTLKIEKEETTSEISLRVLVNGIPFAFDETCYSFNEEINHFPAKTKEPLDT